MPRYTSPQITEEPVSLPNVSAEAFGAQDAAALTQLGQGLQRVSNVAAANLLDAKQRENKVAARGKLVEARTDLREFLNSDIYTRQGEALNTSYIDSLKKADELRKTHSKALINQTQKDLFLASYDHYSTQALDRVSSFQRVKMIEAEGETLRANINQNIEDSVEGRYNSIQIANNELDVIRDTASIHAGKDKQIIKHHVRQAVHTQHLAVLNALTNDSPTVGLEYFNNNAEKFLPSTRTGLKADLEKKSGSEIAYELAKDLVNSGATPEEIQTAIDAANLTPEVRKAAQQNADTRIARQIRNNKIAYDQEFERSAQAVRESLDENDISYKLKHADQEKLRTFIRKEAKLNLNNSAQRYEKYQELLKLAQGSDIDRKKFVNTSLAEEALLNVGQEYYDKLVSLQNTVRRELRGEAKAQADLVKSRTFNSYMKDMLEFFGYKDDFEASARIEQWFEEQLNSYPEDERDKFSTWNELKDALSLEVEVGDWFDPTLAKAIAQDRIVLGADQIPTGELPEGVPVGSRWFAKTIQGKLYIGYYDPMTRKLYTPANEVIFIGGQE